MMHIRDSGARMCTLFDAGDDLKRTAEMLDAIAQQEQHGLSQGVAAVLRRRKWRNGRRWGIASEDTGLLGWHAIVFDAHLHLIATVVQGKTQAARATVPLHLGEHLARDAVEQPPGFIGERPFFAGENDA